MDALKEVKKGQEAAGLTRARRKAAGKAVAGAEGVFFARDADRRGTVRQYYQKLDKTKEWAENNYYHLPIEKQTADLITVSAFWRDYAQREVKKATPFRSRNFAEASRSFPEMMLALAVLDLPFKAEEHESEFDKAKMTLTTGSPIIVFHEEVKPAEPVNEQTPILVSQNFFRHGDRYRHVNNERVDKFVTEEFLTHVVYGCQVIVTNPTSSRQKLDILLQVPRGAIPVLRGRYTRSLHVDLQPYRTRSVDYHFYFPAVGKYPHYPVQVAKNEKLVAHAEAFTFNVVAEPSKIDRESWDFISQHGTDEAVLTYLKTHNLHRTRLERIAFRMKNGEFFRSMIDLLAARHVYNHILWSYSIKHNDPTAVRSVFVVALGACRNP
jgi:hypothetical protein